MNNYRFSLLLAAAITMSVVTYAQTDNDQIQHAKNAISVNGNCDDALRYLDKVSIAGKMTEDYLLYMGKANDCKQNNEQALYYYKKYLELGPANDSVKLRVAQLSDQKVQTAKVANEERVARESYQTVAHTKKKKKRLNINDNFILAAASYDAGLGGANAPYKSGLSIIYSGCYPIAYNHLLLSYALNSGFLFSPNTNWFANVFALPQDNVSGVGLGISESLSFIPMAVIINTHHLSLTAGPEIGVGSIYTPEPSKSLGGSVAFNDGEDFTISYGAKAYLFLGDNFTASLEYTTCNLKSVSSEYGGVTQSFAANHDMLRIGIGYRFEPWGWW